MNATEVYAGSDGDATKALYAELDKLGPIGVVALNLFRAQKCSARAKVYRGGVRGRGSYRSMAYERKEWSIQNLCEALEKHADTLNIGWGWKRDPATIHGGEPMWVLYVDLRWRPPYIALQGHLIDKEAVAHHPASRQVSFHAPKRGKGPDYAGDWDGEHLSAERIIAFCDLVLGVDRSA